MGNCCTRDAIGTRHSYICENQLAELPESAYVLRVGLRECENLRNADFAGKSDPYVVLSLASSMDLPKGAQRQTSSCISGDVNPKWRPPETFSCAAASFVCACFLVTTSHTRVLQSSYSNRRTHGSC